MPEPSTASAGARPSCTPRRAQRAAAAASRSAAARSRAASRAAAAGRRGDRRRGPRRRLPDPAIRGRGGTAAPRRPERASRQSAAAVGDGTCPTSQPPALPAGQTRTVTLDTPKGAIVIKVEADLSPIAAGNFVALAVVRLLRRHAVPPDVRAPGRHAVRDPGRRPDRDAARGGPGLHDQGRAGHDALQARHRRDGPLRRPELASARSSSSSSTTRTGRRSPIGQHLPDHRHGHLGDGRRSTPSAGARPVPRLPTNPVPITTATVANP